MTSPSGYKGNRIPKGYSQGQLQQFTPEQMQLLQQMIDQVGPDSYLARLAGGDESIFQEVEAPALRQFSSTLGNISSRFSGMGQGGRKSSAFQHSTTAAASDFAQQLQSQRMNLQRQAVMDLQNIGNQLLGQRPYEQFLVEKQQKDPWFKSWAPAVGAGVGFFTGGLPGAAAGYQAGSKFSEGF